MTKTILKSKNAFEKICNKKFTYKELCLLATSNKFLTEQEKLQKKVVQNKMYKLKYHGLSVQNYEACILMIEVELGPKAVQHKNQKQSNFKDRPAKTINKACSPAIDRIIEQTKSTKNSCGSVTGKISCNCENKCTMLKTVKSNTFGLLHKQTQRIKLIGSIDKTMGYLECLKDHQKVHNCIRNIVRDYEVVEVFYKIVKE